MFKLRRLAAATASLGLAMITPVHAASVVQGAAADEASFLGRVTSTAAQ
ncbi:hypothetical protein [Caballeronia sp.]